LTRQRNMRLETVAKWLRRPGGVDGGVRAQTCKPPAVLAVAGRGAVRPGAAGAPRVAKVMDADDEAVVSAAMAVLWEATRQGAERRRVLCTPRLLNALQRVLLLHRRPPAWVDTAAGCCALGRLELVGVKRCGRSMRCGRGVALEKNGNKPGAVLVNNGGFG
jgi:hypothetical protein